LAVATSTKLAVSSAKLLACLDLGEIWASTDSTEELDGSSGLCDVEGGRLDDERDLWDGAHVMTTGEEEGGDSGCSEGGSSGEALLAQVDLLVPLAPDLGGCKHATGAAHVTESSLTSTVSTTTRDTRDTGDGATWEERKKGVSWKLFS